LFLRDLDFADGSGSPVCATRQNLAWTYLNGRTIYLCGMEFASTAHSNPRFVANLLIHEGLHSLGLGENPPRPPEIDAQILRRCR